MMMPTRGKRTARSRAGAERRLSQLTAKQLVSDLARRGLVAKSVNEFVRGSNPSVRELAEHLAMEAQRGGGLGGAAALTAGPGPDYGAARPASFAALMAGAPVQFPLGAAAAATSRVIVSVVGGFTLVDVLVEGYAIPLHWSTTAANTAVGERPVPIEGIISIGIKCISTGATTIVANLTVDGKKLTPIQALMPAGDSGYVPFYRNK
jgi:hypothetical protein